MCIKKSMKSEKNVTLESPLFSKCSAIYGGAVYIYSSYETSSVMIRACKFLSNKASGRKTKKSENELYIRGLPWQCNKNQRSLRK